MTPPTWHLLGSPPPRVPGWVDVGREQTHCVICACVEECARLKADRLADSLQPPPTPHTYVYVNSEFRVVHNRHTRTCHRSTSNVAPRAAGDGKDVGHPVLLGPPGGEMQPHATPCSASPEGRAGTPRRGMAGTLLSKALACKGRGVLWPLSRGRPPALSSPVQAETCD
jgi:hypothetical protein